MPTDHQLNFVADMEAAIKALEAQGVKAPKIGQIMEHAGQNPAGLHAMVTRLKEHKEKELLSRLRKVFESCSKMPICLEDVKPPKEVIDEIKAMPYMQPEPVHLPSGTGVPVKLPLKMGTIVQSKGFVGSPIHLPEQDALETQYEIGKMLRPFNKHEREKILSSVGMFYGVGE